MPRDHIRGIRNGDAGNFFAGAKMDGPLKSIRRIEQPTLIRFNIETGEVPYGNKRQPDFAENLFYKFRDLP